jgi:hypothetical protein
MKRGTGNVAIAARPKRLCIGIAALLTATALNDCTELQVAGSISETTNGVTACVRYENGLSAGQAQV